MLKALGSGTLNTSELSLFMRIYRRIQDSRRQLLSRQELQTLLIEFPVVYGSYHGGSGPICLNHQPRSFLNSYNGGNCAKTKAV